MWERQLRARSPLRSATLAAGLAWVDCRASKPSAMLRSSSRPAKPVAGAGGGHRSRLVTKAGLSGVRPNGCVVSLGAVLGSSRWRGRRPRGWWGCPFRLRRSFNGHGRREWAELPRGGSPPRAVWAGPPAFSPVRLSSCRSVLSSCDGLIWPGCGSCAPSIVLATACASYFPLTAALASVIPREAK